MGSKTNLKNLKIWSLNILKTYKCIIRIQILFLSSFTPRERAVFQNTLGVGTDGFKRPSLQMLYSPNLNYYHDNYRPGCYVSNVHLALYNFEYLYNALDSKKDLFSCMRVLSYSR